MPKPLSIDQAMELAIAEAKKGAGFTSPNPLVGCVIIDKAGELLSKGAHLQYGQAHAEVNAINGVKDPAQFEGATVVVTLEPCAHQGKTGSCAVALSKLSIKQVVYGLSDPNPLVAGKGRDILINAGIDAKLYDGDKQRLEQVCEQFLFHMQNKRPFVALKVATSLDGQMALANGESQWITGPAARTHSRTLRAHYDATLIGAGTFIADNPRLDFRDTPFEGQKTNKVILFDPKGKAATAFPGSHIESIYSKENIFVITPEAHVKPWSALPVTTLYWNPGKEGWDQVLSSLYQKGVYSVFVEGGRFVFAELIRYGLAQKLYHYQAPKILGDGFNWTELLKLDSLTQAYSLSQLSATKIGQDTLVEAYF